MVMDDDFLCLSCIMYSYPGRLLHSIGEFNTFPLSHQQQQQNQGVDESAQTQSTQQEGSFTKSSATGI